MTSFLPPQAHVPLHKPFPDALSTPPPAEWMPLDEIAAAWGVFGARTRDALRFAGLLSPLSAASADPGAGAGALRPPPAPSPVWHAQQHRPFTTR